MHIANKRNTGRQCPNHPQRKKESENPNSLQSPQTGGLGAPLLALKDMISHEKPQITLDIEREKIEFLFDVGATYSVLTIRKGMYYNITKG